jgi:hypothetical protein
MVVVCDGALDASDYRFRWERASLEACHLVQCYLVDDARVPEMVGADEAKYGTLIGRET